MYFIAWMESIDSNPATIALIANQTSFNPYLDVAAAAAKYVQLVFVTNLAHIIFLQNFFFESPDMNDTTNMCQALWCLFIL